MLFPCSDTYKCRGNFCLPFRRVCDGVIDCPLGDDEEGCHNYACVGMAKCRTLRRLLFVMSSWDDSPGDKQGHFALSNNV